MTTQRVLIVEDNEDIRAILKKRFEDSGFLVEMAPDGFSVLSYMKDGAVPDAVVLDLMLPQRSGTDLLCSLKTKWPDTKVFIFSAREEYKNKMSLYGEFVTAFICKSEGVGQLLKVIKDHVPG